jgi:hypothetical protein
MLIINITVEEGGSASEVFESYVWRALKTLSKLTGLLQIVTFTIFIVMQSRGLLIFFKFVIKKLRLYFVVLIFRYNIVENIGMH